MVDVISKGAAQSWQMENRHGTMLAGEFEHGFAVEWMRKDLALALEEARRNGARLPVTALVDQLYAEVEALGGEPLGHLEPAAAPRAPEAVDLARAGRRRDRAFAAFAPDQREARRPPGSASSSRVSVIAPRRSLLAVDENTRR